MSKQIIIDMGVAHEFFHCKNLPQDIFAKFTQLSSPQKSSGPSLNKKQLNTVKRGTNHENVARKDFLPSVSLEVSRALSQTNTKNTTVLVLAGLHTQSQTPTKILHSRVITTLCSIHYSFKGTEIIIPNVQTRNIPYSFTDLTRYSLFPFHPRVDDKTGSQHFHHFQWKKNEI